ncbi:hypothetical protein BFJ72_g15334, partial [Fusarium proliferatum]
MATATQTRGAKRRALSQVEHQETAFSEPYDAGKDGDFLSDKVSGNGGHHKKRKQPTGMKQQQQQQEQKQPGWWPEEYAPENPNCPVIVSRMNKVIRNCKGAKYPVENIWDDDGFMVKAIQQAKQTRVTQRTFNRLEYPFPLGKSKKGVAKAGPELQRNSSNVTGSHTQHVATDAPALPLPDQDGSDESPLSSKDSMSGSQNDRLSTSPNRPLSVDSDKSFPALPTLPPVSETISHLRGSDWLTDSDMLRCVKLLKASDEWHIFDPGYPSEASKLSGTNKVYANNLIFFINAKLHWSLCHLDRQIGQLKHYNSLPWKMPVDVLKSWILEQPRIRPTDGLKICEEKCAQQEDGFNCGIFTLAVCQALVNGNPIPLEVDANGLRSFFAKRLESPTSPEFAKPSSEAASLGMPQIGCRPSFEQSHSDADNFGLLDNSGEHDMKISDTLNYLDKFEKCLGKANANLTEDMKALEKHKGKVVEMLQEQDALERKLENEQRLAADLAGKVEQSQIDYKGACEWLNQHGTGRNVEPANTLLNKIITDAKSMIQSSAADIESCKERLESMQANCDE